MKKGTFSWELVTFTDVHCYLADELQEWMLEMVWADSLTAGT